MAIMNVSTPSLVTFWACVVLSLAPLSGGAAQEFQATGLEISRENLQAALARYEEAAATPGYSRRLREQAEREAQLIRVRLEEGDFRVGDRIVVQVRFHPEFPDTLVVESGQLVRVPDIGEIQLGGVLRSELNRRLTEELARYIRNPVVTSRSLVRLSIMGQVNQPGFLVLPASALLEEALMAAGGAGRHAKPERGRGERGAQTVWEGAALQEALMEGRTLDQLSLQAGDRITVPEQRPAFFNQGVARTLLITLPPLILLATRTSWW
jgi:protein involved in polysaccharide export with SLBB domain